MKKLLTVDDDIQIGNVLEETLSKEGYKISYTIGFLDLMFKYNILSKFKAVQ